MERNCNHAEPIMLRTMLLLLVVLQGVANCPTPTLGVELDPEHSANGTTAAKPSSIEDTRAKALAWIDAYLPEQVLLTPGDAATFRERVARMSPQEAAAWLEQTAPLRTTLMSPSWLETRNWLRRFFEVQAVYSEHDLLAFRQQVPGMSVSELEATLNRLMNRHAEMKRLHALAEMQRQSTLQWRDSYLRNTKDAQRLEIERRRPQASALYRANLPSCAGPPPGLLRPYRIPPPLVTSRGVARDVVRAAVIHWPW